MKDEGWSWGIAGEARKETALEIQRPFSKKLSGIAQVVEW